MRAVVVQPLRTVYLLAGLILPALWLVSGCQEAARESSVPAAGRGAPAPEQQAVGTNVNLALIDAAIAPGDDFYRYANGAWLATYELPDDKTVFGNFYELHDQAQERVQAIIEELSATDPAPGTVAQQIGDYYLSFMDTRTLDERGIDPIRAELARIRAISSSADLARAFGRSAMEAGATPLSLGIEIDRKDPTRFIAGVYASGLGLPERDYYLEDSERFQSIREAYAAHIASMLRLIEAADLAALADDVLALETEIARAHWPRADRRNRDLTYNLSSPAELQENYPRFDWPAFFAASGVTPPVINIGHPSAMAPIIATVNEVPPAVWQAYLTYHLLTGNASYLATAIDDASFEFYGRVLYGQPEQRERWRRAVRLVSSSQGLGDAVGQVYVERYFPAASRAMMQELVENLRTALRQRIDALDWMGPATRARALEKLAGFLPKIGYPDDWRDFSSVTIRRDDLMGNVRALRAYFQADAIRRLSEPTDRHEWYVPAQTVNAFYSPQFNAITFPAGILEPPFFNPDADPAVNYGAIGAVIGHEMGHGFDDQGSKSNAAGVQENWWSDDDRARFEARAARLEAQYSAYEAVPGTRIDGAFTLGENIGDLGGINIAYQAYRNSLNGVAAPVLDGLTGDQRFFIAYAQLWRAKIREEALVSRLKSDPHAPAPYRANGVVRNVDAWYEAFAIGEDAALYLPPQERVRIW